MMTSGAWLPVHEQQQHWQRASSTTTSAAYGTGVILRHGGDTAVICALVDLLTAVLLKAAAHLWMFDWQSGCSGFRH
jgi:hypothetical protein